MRKLATLLMIFTILFLTACNAVESPKKQDEQKELTLEQVIEQLGQDSFSKDGLNEHTHIADYGGYTYVITPVEGYTKSLRLIVSVLKDNEFVVKEKESNLRIKNASLKYQFSNNNLFIRTTKYSRVPLDTTYKVSIDEEGKVRKQVIEKDVPRNKVTTTFVQGLKGVYLATLEDEHYQIWNADGEVMYALNTADFHRDDYEILFLDEKNGKMYLRLQEKKQDTNEAAYVFDLNTEQMVMKNDSTKQQFVFPISDVDLYQGGNNGFYVVDDQTLSFYSIGKEKVQLVDETALDASVENGEDLYLTVDDQYVNVYQIEGSRIQKYSYTRVDK